RLPDAFDSGRAESLQLEIPLDQGSHVSADYRRTRRRQGLEPRGETGRVPNRAIFGVLGAGLDTTHYNLADIDADAQLQIKPLVGAQRFAIVSHRLVHAKR